MPFTEKGKPWEDEVWVRGHRSRVHWCTLGLELSVKSRSRESRQPNIQVYILAKRSGLGIFVWKSSA